MRDGSQAPTVDALATYQIPLPGSHQLLSLTGPWPLTPEQWGYLESLLSVMRPGLVQEPPPAMISPVWIAWQEVIAHEEPVDRAVRAVAE